MLTERPTVFDHHVLALDEARFAQASSKCLHQMRGVLRRPGAEITDHRHRRLLRARRERPRRDDATEQRDELAPPHSITSSASAISLSGIERPSALAVLRLITSSYFDACSTGRSAGLAPLRILSM